MLLQLFLTFSSVAAFVPLPQLSPCINGPLQSIVPSLHRRHHNCRDRVTRFETDKDFEVPVSREVLEPKKTVDSATRSADTIQAIQAKQVEDEQKYPLDVPSPILLGTSIFLAIASVGSLYELLGGQPQLGIGLTAMIVIAGIPLSLYLFYASILKARAETEQDDKDFREGNRGNTKNYF